MKLINFLEYQNIYNQIKEFPLPLKTTYKLAKIMNKADEEIKFYQDQFQKILDQYAVKNNNEYEYTEDHQSIKIISGMEKECNGAVIALQNFEVEDLPNVSFSIDELEGLNLTIAQINCLMPFIKE